MLNRLRIGPRLLLLISVQAVLLIAVGLTAVAGLRAAAHGTSALNRNIQEQSALNQMNEVLRTDVFATISDATRGHLAWDQARMDVLAAKNLLTSLWDEYQADKTPQEISELRDSLAKHHDLLMLAFSDLENIFAEQDAAKLVIYQDAQLKRLTMPFMTELNERIAAQELQSEVIFQRATSSSWAYVVGSIAVVVLGLAVTGALGLLFYRSTAGSLKTIAATVNDVAGGDNNARTGLSGADELSMLGSAFDHVLDERMATLLQVEQDNERFNDVATMLLHAASKLRSRDVMKLVPASADVTAPVVDALNQLTSETAQVLIDVQRIAEQVAKASVVARTQTDVISAMAAHEQSEIDAASQAMTQAGGALKQVAESARRCDHSGDSASAAAHTALQSVTQSVGGLHSVRSILKDAEQCVKRLDERSHDVWRTSSLLNSIAERAQVLALNTSMQGASSGRSKSSFAAITEEVERLAETARDAAQQITVLVSDMQSDVEDTVLSFNSATSQVAAGCELAEQAGEHVLHSNDHTRQLVESARQIASDSAAQILLSNELQGRIQTLQASAGKTRDQILEQTQHTKRLVQYSKGLLSSIQVFAHAESGQESSQSETTDAAVQLTQRAS